MFAVIKTGGKQYKVAAGDVISVERLAGDVGKSLELDQVLMIGDDKGTTVGAPLVDGASVSATVLDQARGDKIIVFKKKRRKDYRRRQGHRQELTVLRITDIRSAGAAKKAKPAAVGEPAKAPEKKAEKKPAENKVAEKKPAAKKAAAEKEAKKPAVGKGSKPAAKKGAAKKGAAGKGKEKG